VPSPIMPGWTTSDFFLVSVGIVELFIIIISERERGRFH
jgi:hypothetical protein